MTLKICTINNIYKAYFTEIVVFLYCISIFVFSILFLCKNRKQTKTEAIDKKVKY